MVEYFTSRNPFDLVMRSRSLDLWTCNKFSTIIYTGGTSLRHNRKRNGSQFISEMKKEIQIMSAVRFYARNHNRNLAQSLCINTVRLYAVN